MSSNEQKVLSVDSKEFRFKINIFKCDTNRRFRGKVVIHDQRGQELINKELFSPHAIVLAVCFMTEASEIIQSIEYDSNRFEPNEIDLKKLSGLFKDVLAKSLEIYNGILQK